MQPYRFASMTFESKGHADWLKGTLGLMCITGVVCVIELLSGSGLVAGALFASLFGLMHLMVAFTAIRGTHFGRRSTSGFSPACIWFNALVALLYSAFLFLIVR